MNWQIGHISRLRNVSRKTKWKYIIINFRLHRRIDNRLVQLYISVFVKFCNRCTSLIIEQHTTDDAEWMNNEKMKLSFNSSLICNFKNFVHLKHFRRISVWCRGYPNISSVYFCQRMLKSLSYMLKSRSSHPVSEWATLRFLAPIALSRFFL